MNREFHLEYCKKCIHQKFNPQLGITCGITNKIADFEGECPNFELDENIVFSQQEKASNKKKSKKGFGFSPKHETSISFTDLSKKEAFVLAYKTAKNLGWDVGYIDATGFSAYSKFSFMSWGEELQVRIGVGEIAFKSECTGNQIYDWGKNRRNIKRFIQAFHWLKDELNTIDIEEEFDEISKQFEDATNGSPIHQKEQIGSFFSLFTPTQGYFITPIIILVNLLFFLIMATDGTSMIAPSIEKLIKWGANYAPLTVNGEYWRLLISNYIHIGFVHLLMNMYALMYIGLMLEPIIGRSRILAAYLITGIASSLWSAYYNEILVCAGASGAIFGMYGLFLAMLSTKLIDKSARKSLLISIGIFVSYSLINGLKGGVDNAAHIGGLVSGYIVGLAFYPSLIKPAKSLKYSSIALTSLLLLGSAYMYLSNTSSQVEEYDQLMQEFNSHEQDALALYRTSEYATDRQILKAIEYGLPAWDKCEEIILQIDALEIPDVLKEKNAILRDYCKARKETYKLFTNAIVEDTEIYQDQIDSLNSVVEGVFDKLNAN